jgi:Flp pilus assembly protein TadD
MIGLLPGLAALIAFAPCVGNDFVDWDDFANITTNKSLRGLGWPQLYWAATTWLLGVYQPVSWILLQVQYSLWELDPRGYHLASLVLYAVAAVVLDAMTVALLVRCLPAGGPRERESWPIHLGAALAGALFAAHPLRTEVVAWVSCQPYLPCAIFSMLTVLAYLHAHPAKGPARVGWSVGAFLLFVLAVLSKAVAVTLPVILVILDVYPLRRIGGGRFRDGVASPSARRAWIEKLPYIAASLVFVWQALAAKRFYALVVHADIKQDTLSVRLAQACYGAWFYLARTAWPAGISPYYPLPSRIAWSDPRFSLAGLAVAGLTVAFFLMRRRRPGLLAAWISYLVILAPNAGLTRIGGQVAADRYGYISMMGLAVLAAAGLARLLASPARAVRAATIAVAVVMLAGLTALSRSQCRVWHDSIALWTHALALSPEPDVMLNYNLGLARFEAGDFPGSLGPLTRALELNPGFVEGRRRMGMTLLRLGRLEEAELYLAEAARLRPDDPELRACYGEILLKRRRPAEAEPELAEAARLQPDEPSIRGNLGAALLIQGKLDEAARQFVEALRLDPGNGDFQSNLGMVRGRQGRLDEAIALCTEAVRNNPGHINARMNLGMGLLQKGRLDEAESQFQELLRRQPGVDAARAGLAEVARRRNQAPAP